jgi:hypothetical protein
VGDGQYEWDELRALCDTVATLRVNIAAAAASQKQLTASNDYVGALLKQQEVATLKEAERASLRRGTTLLRQRLETFDLSHAIDTRVQALTQRVEDHVAREELAAAGELHARVEVLAPLPARLCGSAAAVLSIEQTFAHHVELATLLGQDVLNGMVAQGFNSYVAAPVLRVRATKIEGALGQLQLEWDVVGPGGVSQYIINATPPLSGGASLSVPTSCTLDGAATDGATHAFTVTARAAGGAEGPPSLMSVPVAAWSNAEEVARNDGSDGWAAANHLQVPLKARIIIAG